MGFSGNSQGAALTHHAIEGLNQTVKDKIAGVVTFGDTQNLQDGGQIRGFDLNKTLIICNVGDLVCVGTLYIMPVHLDYVKWVPTAVSWLIQKLLAADELVPWKNGTFILPPPPGLPPNLPPHPKPKGRM
jgi:cutinase